MALSKRIETITTLVGVRHETVFDLCCDHGLIGLEVLKQTNSKVIFVDIVHEIMEKLSINLKATDIPSGNYSIITSNAIDLKVPQNACFIIAGIGGELAIKILENILNQVDQFEVIISANNNLIKLRKFLISKNLKMVDEILVKDNKQFYEILKISHFGNEEITEIGTKMWQNPKNHHFEYIEQQISYYKKSAKYSINSNRLLSSFEILKANTVVKEEN